MVSSIAATLTRRFEDTGAPWRDDCQRRRASLVEGNLGGVLNARNRLAGTCPLAHRAAYIEHRAIGPNGLAESPGGINLIRA